jgi:tetratricopeptide (TPR) repeat protein
MRKIMMRYLPLAFGAALALASVPGALAFGGGGGMGSSGGSSTSLDPAKAYQDGVAAYNAHDYKSAIEHFKEALDVVPDDMAANYALGLSYIGDNDPKRARRALEKAVRNDKAPADAYLQLGLVYLQLDDKDKATAQQTAIAEKLKSCGCSDKEKSDWQTASDKLTQALQGGSAKPTGWNFPGSGEGRKDYAEAVGLINHHRYEEALTVLARAEAAIGPHPDILNYEGFANRHLGRYDIAITKYKRALAINPDHIGANEYLGELYLEIGRVADAKAQLAKLDTLCPFGCVEREELAGMIGLASN